MQRIENTRLILSNRAIFSSDSRYDFLKNWNQIKLLMPFYNALKCFKGYLRNKTIICQNVKKVMPRSQDTQGFVF